MCENCIILVPVKYILVHSVSSTAHYSDTSYNMITWNVTEIYGLSLKHCAHRIMNISVVSIITLQCIHTYIF